MVVDDDPDTADSLTDLLTIYGFTVRTAYCGADALHLAAAEPPDVVLFDIVMPGMNGWELARQLAKATKPPILVAITGCQSDRDRNESNASGVHLHLLKPVEPALLFGMLRRFASTLTPRTIEDGTMGCDPM
jgi:CheY-like chemotaxis protein